MRINPVPSAFSFMLPGLGQVYQRRLIPAALFFSGFTALHFVSVGRWLLPLVAVAASAEAYFYEKKVPSPSAQPRSRLVAFFIVAIIGLVSWTILAGPAFLPVGNLLDVKESAEGYAAAVRRCKSELKKLPQAVSECASPRFPADPWGNAFQYRVIENGFVLRSPGRDQLPETGDDFVFRYRE